ncbi:hypothetical protein ACU8KH_05236 [Lachancea thermotolerans]
MYQQLDTKDEQSYTRSSVSSNKPPRNSEDMLTTASPRRSDRLVCMSPMTESYHHL